MSAQRRRSRRTCDTSTTTRRSSASASTRTRGTASARATRSRRGCCRTSTLARGHARCWTSAAGPARIIARARAAPACVSPAWTDRRDGARGAGAGGAGGYAVGAAIGDAQRAAVSRRLLRSRDGESHAVPRARSARGAARAASRAAAGRPRGDGDERRRQLRARSTRCTAPHARRLGYAASPHDALRFTLDDLPLVRSAFPSAEVFVREDAFVFPEAAPALRFYASYAIDSIEDRPAGREPSRAAAARDGGGDRGDRRARWRVPGVEDGRVLRRGRVNAARAARGGAARPSRQQRSPRAAAAPARR